MAPRRKCKRRPRAASVQEESCYEATSDDPFVVDISPSPLASGYCTSSSSSTRFFVDTEGDPAPLTRRRPPHADSKEGAAATDRSADDAHDVTAQPKDRLAFTILPSTSTGAAASAPAEAPELSALNRFYAESSAEAKRRDAKAFFVLNRYYFGEGGQKKATAVGANDTPAAAPDTARALRTDDGYLTKMGAKHFCVVCCGSGHRAHSCPELRCYICFATGHSVKDCPKAKEKCQNCSRKGHSADSCILQLLTDAAKQRSLRHVRCVRCGQIGHPMCHGASDTGAAASEEEDLHGRAAEERASEMAAVLTGKRSSYHTGARAEYQQSWAERYRDHSEYKRSKGRNCKRGWEYESNSWTGCYTCGGDHLARDCPKAWGKQSWEKPEVHRQGKRVWQDPREELRAKLQKQQSRDGGSNKKKVSKKSRSSHNYGPVPNMRIRNQPSARQSRRNKEKAKNQKRGRRKR